MVTWITSNIGNIVVTLILVAVVTAVIFKMIKDKKNGTGHCGANCASCGIRESCQRKDKGV